MNITTDTRLSAISKEYPWLLDEVMKLDARAKMLNNPMGKMFIQNSTIKGLSDMTGLGTDTIIDYINNMIESHEAG